MSNTKGESEAIERVESNVPSIAGVGKDDYQGKRVDDALQFALERGQTTWTIEEEKKILRKIDMVLLPLMFIGMCIAYADTQAYGFAALFGLVEDLNLFTVSGIIKGQTVIDTTRYQFSAGITALGSMAGQYPILTLVQYLPMGKSSSVVIFYCGLLSLLVIVCRDFADIMALRFFYGFQTVLQPFFVIITSMWWKTEEQPFRVGIWISGASVGSLVGQGIDFGGIKVGGAYATSPWKWIYVILGSVAMGSAMVMFLLFPNTPMESWFLTKREKDIAVQRLKGNNTGIQTRTFKWKQALEAFKDPQLYILCVFAFSFAFAGFLVSSFGYSAEESLKLTMPASAIAIVAMVSSGLIGAKLHRYRILIAMLYILPTLAGNILLWKSPRDSKGALLTGLFISTVFYGALVQQLSLLSSNIAGHTKKTVVNATIFFFANAGSFSGPWAYKGDEATRGYPTGQISTLSLMCACEVCFAMLWLYYRYCNKKKAQILAEYPELGSDPNIAFMDFTDKENPLFQYAC